MAAPLPSALAAMIAPFCSPEAGPGDGPFQSISLEGIRAAAGHLGISPREAMAFCLEHNVWPLRFARNRGVFNAGEQRRLLGSRIAIIGCGGLGGHVITLLARAGVGAFTLCDFDRFDESNLNRQLLCREAYLGRNKAEAAREELHRIASHADVRVFSEKAEPGNLAEILRDADSVVDCLDSLKTRRHVAAAAGSAGISFIYGSVAGEEGFAMAASPGDKSLDAFFGDGAVPDACGAELRLGVPTLTPAAVAVLQARLALHLLAGRTLEKRYLHHLDLSGPMLELLSL